MANFVEGEWDWMNPQGQDVVLGSKRKQRFADILRKQATAPQGQMVGNIYVPPSILQHFASGINNYNANRLEREAGQDLEGAIKQRQEQMQTASQRLAQALRPKQVQQGETKLPFEPNQMNQFGTPMEGALQQTVPNMVERQPTPQDLMMAQAQFAQDIGDPRLMQQAVGQQLNYNIGQQQREEERAFRSQEAQANREARMQEMAIKIQEGRATRQEQNEFRKELAQMNIDARRDLAGIAAANRPEKMISIMGPDGSPILVPQSQAAGSTPYNPTIAKNLKLKETTGKAKNEVNQIVEQLGSAYSTLKNEGGITSADQGFMGNLGAMASNTGAGQLLGRAGGTQNQQARDTIAQTRPLLLNAIKNATGMSAQQMNSNAEMQLYLRAATDPSLGYEANAKALENLDKLYGLGMYKGVGSQQQSGTIGKPPAGAVRRKQ